MVAMMDFAVRLILACYMPPIRKSTPPPPQQEVWGAAGGVPRRLIADSLGRYHIAFRNVIRMRKDTRSIHMCGIHPRNLTCNTSKQMRLN